MSTLRGFPPDDDTPVFVISVRRAAGMHAQPCGSTTGSAWSPVAHARRGRRYSARDVALLREVQRLSQEEGVSLAGIQRILRAENGHRTAGSRGRASDELDRARQSAGSAAGARVFAVGPNGDVIALRAGQRPRQNRSQALVVWKPHF